jgi:hypothetical protein
MQICGVHYAADEIGSLAFAGRNEVYIGRIQCGDREGGAAAVLTEFATLPVFAVDGTDGRNFAVVRPTSVAKAPSDFGIFRNCAGGRSGSFTDFHPAMALAHCRACSLLLMPGKRRRNSLAAANSPPRSNAARIAAASSSETTNII